MRYWILALDPEFCTVDNLRLGRHGWGYVQKRTSPHRSHDGRTSAVVNTGDVAVLFYSRTLTFRCLGRFMTGVSASREEDGSTRYDFLVDVTSRRQTPESLAGVKRRLLYPRHPIRATQWLTRVLTRLSRSEFDALMQAWWGGSNCSHELESATASAGAKNVAKYEAYVYAFGRLSDAIDRGYNLEAVTIAESIIADRIISACHRAQRNPGRLVLSALLEIASRLNPPLPKGAEFDLWRQDRNQVVHGIVKGTNKAPLLPPAEFLDLAEKTAVRGAVLARTASAWSRRVR